MADNLTRALRTKLRKGAGILVPGASNALMARIVKASGFDAATVPGSGVTNSFLGAPDLGLLTLTELAQHVAAIRENVDLPLVIDADTGFGNALNVRRTVKVLERAGASAVILEDQDFPKRNGLFADNPMIAATAMSDKIKAATDAREDSDFLIIARSDAIRVTGIGDAVDRANVYIEAGADLTFVVNPRDRDQMRQIAALPAPQVVNIIVGGVTPMLPLAEFQALGFAMILYANAPLQAAMLAMKEVLNHLKREGSLDGISDRLVDFETRQEMVGKAEYDALERRYTRSYRE